MIHLEHSFCKAQKHGHFRQLMINALKVVNFCAWEGWKRSVGRMV